VSFTHTVQGQSAASGRSALRKAAHVAGTLVAVVVVMAAAVAVVIAIATRLSATEEYTAFGHPALVVLSGSMTPTIDTGDLIVDNPVTPAQAKHLRVGQVATFLEAPRSQSSITHRIVKVEHHGGQTYYVTKGDANNAADTPARPASLVVGTYAWKIPRGGYFLDNLHNPIVLGLLLAAPFLWLLAATLLRRARGAGEP
jgi:signal peptidase